MISVLTPSTRVNNEDWDAVRQSSRSPSRNRQDIQSSQEVSDSSCNSCVKSCVHGLRNRVRADFNGCTGCTNCANRLWHQGWRKWCLFALISFLIFLVVVNLALTLWIMNIMEFSRSGMGALRVHSGGLELSGKAFVMDSLVASHIQTSPGRPLHLETYDNFTIVATNDKGDMENRIFIDKDKFECQSSNLLIEDSEGNLLFSSNPNEVKVGARALRITGEGGAIFGESVTTPLIHADSGQDLRFESLTRSISIEGAKDILINSNAGSINAITLKDVQFKSRTGAIKLDSPKIYLSSLEIAQTLDKETTRMKSKDKLKTYQVCVCENGRLFLASPRGVCEMYDAVFLCQT